MTRTLLFSLGALLALGVGACGGDDEEDKAMMGTVNEASAKSTAMQSISATTTLTSSMDPNAGQAAANQYMAVAMGAQGIVTPAVPQAGTGAGTCTCEGTSCTFQDCGDDNGQVTMSGTISWTGGNVVMDIDYNVTQGVTTYELPVEGDITVTETSITGYLKSNGSLSGFEAGGQGADVGAYSWSSSIEYMDVTFNGTSPTGGSVHVEATYSIAGQNYAGEADVTFP